ncbi:hypothetical protein B4U80_14118 [Leptotrombidium deliense]|uniref:Serpin domain-containing protein n=1 Tax=Leptotrombidium deliense TaxID=299467 RepID=A0A443S296_9ACAR|nr:hypothetical protein B4U80_14118 [Leptotrombidium deliense]
MTLLGARNKTKNEMFQGLRYSLGFSSSDDVHSYFKTLLDECEKSESCTLNIANRVLIHKSDDFRIDADYALQLLLGTS